MAGPKTTNQTIDICSYTSDVTGRVYGLAKCETYITDSAKRAVLKDVADKVDAKLQELFKLYIARITLKLMTHRRNLGEGCAIDRAFDKHVAHCAESVRTGPAGGSRDNAPYQAVFDEGTAPFQSPTIRDDPELAEELGRRLAKLDDFRNKQPLLDDNAKLEALIGPASAAVVNGEKQLSKDFTTEVEARQAVIDELWLAKKALEMTFKRDRALLKFIFFDFSKDDSGSGEQPPGGGNGGGEGGGEGPVADTGAQTGSGNPGGSDDSKPS